MDDRKKVKVKNSFLDLSFNWNKTLVSTQVCIFAGLICLRLFAHTGAVRKLCFWIFIVDVLYLLVVFLKGLIVSKEDGAVESGKEETKSVDVTAESSSSGNSGTVKTSDATITNKVAIPNPEASEQAKQKDNKPSPTVTEENASSSDPIDEQIPLEEFDMEDLLDIFSQ